MAEGVNTPHSAEKKEEGENGQIPNEAGENMDVELPNGADADASVSEEEPQREIGQIDHINKSLLSSFLSRLNDPATSSLFPSTQIIDSEPDECEDGQNDIIHT